MASGLRPTADRWPGLMQGPSRDPRPSRARPPRRAVADVGLAAASVDARAQDRLPERQEVLARLRRNRDQTRPVSSQGRSPTNCPSRCAGQHRPRPATEQSFVNLRSAIPGQHRRRRRRPERVWARIPMVLTVGRSPDPPSPRGERRVPRVRRARRVPRTPKGPRARDRHDRGDAPGRGARRASRLRSSSSDVAVSARASPSVGTRCVCRCGRG